MNKYPHGFGTRGNWIKDIDKWFQLLKISELSDITYSIFEDLCQTDNDMLWIEDEDSSEFYGLDKEENMLLQQI